MYLCIIYFQIKTRVSDNVLNFKTLKLKSRLKYG